MMLIVVFLLLFLLMLFLVERSYGQSQGDGAKALLKHPKPAAQLRVVIVPGKTNVFTWRYPRGATNYWWNLEGSTNLKNWVVIVSNVSGDLAVNATRRDPMKLYRLIGRTRK